MQIGCGNLIRKRCLRTVGGRVETYLLQSLVSSVPVHAEEAEDVTEMAQVLALNGSREW